ncbi:hypothetical protein OGAPHI_006828 [Ogataea philodendri]|uniref:Zn(2)-C6 fungal-type domain-containing protein n=1 Tax=Ogataea philodendri TaxID=1378263 RepID=A0A9P8NY80_9ASCO|nr:uncharacterized protein OGAPHI_006828 [Ogataea philodendri]KAH3661421.1 hypothetical protein OGAPHI_006828 [Ogataea philodendri]
MRGNNRPSFACIPCTLRKVKCDKNIPCRNCVRRKLAHECRRKEPVPIINKPHDTPQTDPKLFNDTKIFHYLYSLRLLTHGTTQIAGLVSTDEHFKFTNWDQYARDFPILVGKLTPELSRTICGYACNYTTFIHQGIVNELFMKDHDNFWDIYASNDRDCLNHFTENTIKTMSSKDYYYWMSLFYAILSTGMYFGADDLQSKSVFTPEQLADFPRVFFRASIDCLFKAGAFEHADVRGIQIFCVLSMCLHALGSTYLHRILLRVSIEATKTLGLDSIKETGDSTVDYQTEICKRLFHSLLIIDSLSNYPKRFIEDYSTPLPSIYSTDHLLGRTDSDLQSFPEACANDDIAGVVYERLMVELGQLKHESYITPTASVLISCLDKMQHLVKRLDTYFGTQKRSKDDYSIRQYAKYLLFSSVTRESLELGIRLQTVVGTEIWATQYREKCLSLANQLLFHSTSDNIPYFYNRYWIVIQHLIYSCLFMLLDMLMFQSPDDQHKLECVRMTFPTIKKLRSYFTVKVGFAIIEKLSYLVSRVRMDHLKNEAIEAISLREFLREMEIINPSVPKFSRPKLVPDLQESQYLRFGNAKELYGAPGYLSATSGNIDNPHNNILTSSVLDDKGWYEFLEFFFGGDAPPAIADI